MPELPEVETVRRGLQPVMEGKVIARLEARRSDLRFPLQPDFSARLRKQFQRQPAIEGDAGQEAQSTSIQGLQAPLWENRRLCLPKTASRVAPGLR